MSDILSIIGLIVGILSVIITVTIYVIQYYQNNREKKIQELLKLQNEFVVCSHWCNELWSYKWYSDMKFSETNKEMEHAISILEEKIRFFKSKKFIYIERYDKDISKIIINYINGLEISIRSLHEVSDLQNAYIEHNFKKGNPHDDHGWDLYESECSHIEGLLKAFEQFEQKLQKNNDEVQKKLESMKYRFNIIDIQFDNLNEE